VLERTIAEILARYPSEVWPDLDLTFVERERRLGGGQILDLCFRDPAGTFWVVELKRDRVTPSTVAQVTGYLAELRRAHPDVEYRAMVVAPVIGARGRVAADAAGIACRSVDVAALADIAARHGIPVGHESAHRPVIKRSTPRSSRVRERGDDRPATSAEQVELLRALDERFPPGSLDSSAPVKVLIEYWRQATPGVPPERWETAAALTSAALEALPGSALSTRSLGRTDPYSTVRTIDGIVAAAVDARQRYVKLDFPLPLALAEEGRDSGLLRIWKPRGYSSWCQSRVGDALAIDQALDLLRTGLAFEFDAHGTEHPPA
jgi:hypothetical protein